MLRPLIDVAEVIVWSYLAGSRRLDLSGCRKMLRAGMSRTLAASTRLAAVYFLMDRVKYTA